MDDEERESNASSDNDQDEVMEDADADADADEGDHEEDENEEEEEEENDGGNDGEDNTKAADAPKAAESTQQGTAENDAQGAAPAAPASRAGSAAPQSPAKQPAAADREPSAAPTPKPIKPGWRPTIDPSRIQAKLYDIVPTMAAPQATSINAFAATPDQRFWITGGSDGYVRKYDAQGTLNGKQLLTVAQRHPFVDSVVKAGILMGYWENEEAPGGAGPGAPGSASGPGVGSSTAPANDHVLSPVYSVAVHAQGLWVLSGTEGGAINLSAGRHEEGKRIACLTKHTSAVSVLTLLPDEKTVLSGSWDKTVNDWDLNTGQVRRRFEGSGGQISAVELRPLCGAPVPSLGAMPDEAEAKDPLWGSTISGNNSQKFRNGTMGNGVLGLNGTAGGGSGSTAVNGEGAGSGFAQSASPAHESLFGSPAGSLFGDDTIGGNGNVFGDDDDDFGTTHTMDMGLSGGDGGHSAGGDVTMGGTDENAASGGVAAGEDATQPQPAAGDGASAATGAGAVQTNAVSGNQQPSPSVVPSQDTSTTTAAAPASVQEPALKPPPEDTKPPPTLVFNSAAPEHADPTQMSDQVFFSASMDGTLRIWDRRVQDPVARIGVRPGVPPWCMGACWSPDGNWIYAGRRNGAVEEYSIHHARAGWAPERSLKLPAGSGAVSCVRAMPNGRHLVVASHDILRLYDLRDSSAFKGSAVPFLIVPGPPRAGVISQLYIDPSARFMVSIAGTRGWEGSSTECLVGYEINVPGS